MKFDSIVSNCKFILMHTNEKVAILYYSRKIRSFKCQIDAVSTNGHHRLPVILFIRFFCLSFVAMCFGSNCLLACVNNMNIPITCKGIVIMT